MNFNSNPRSDMSAAGGHASMPRNGAASSSARLSPEPGEEWIPMVERRPKEGQMIRARRAEYDCLQQWSAVSRNVRGIISWLPGYGTESAVQ
jgi:hypothetical protein